MSEKKKVSKKVSDAAVLINRMDHLSDEVNRLERVFNRLSREWSRYEASYRAYVSKRTRIKRFLIWLYYKVTFTTKPKLTRVQLIKHTADKMAGIFHTK